MGETERTKKASAVVLNTFESFEQEALDAISSLFPPTYSVGPLNLLFGQIPADNELKRLRRAYGPKTQSCLDWLDTKNLTQWFM